MKQNYKAWELSIGDFYNLKTKDERLRFLINFAVLAPSSHNTQPWQFKIVENSIFVYAEMKRCLLESDKNNRQLFISLGCAIENIIIAAQYYGYLTNVDYLPDENEISSTAKISFSETEKNQNKNYKTISSILSRSMNRNKYDDTVLPENLLEQVKLLGTSDLSVHIIKDGNRKNLLADITLNAAVNAMEDKGFRKELSKYVKSNVTKSKTGMPGFGLGIPLPMSFIVSKLLRYVNMNKLSRRQDEKLLKKYTPAFVIISTKDDNKKSWMQAGRIYEKIAIMAESNDIKTSIWAAPIQIKEFYKDFQKVIGTDFRPQVFFRIGYSDKILHHSPRLIASEVTK